jgi:DNA polymerase-1
MKKVGLGTLMEFENHVREVEEHFWGKRFSGYAAWKNHWFEAYLKRGYFDTLTGFRCSSGKTGLMAKNDAVNYPIQGSAFHCLLKSLIKLDEDIRRRNMKSIIIGQIHDSILFDVEPSELDFLLKLCKTVTTLWLPKVWPWIIVPLEIEAEVAPVGGSWHDKEKVKL